MTVVAFEGAAGCGKTHRLVATLREAVRERPLREGQRVLATTYMHGSRRRLDARLRQVDGHPSYECSTLDSVAWRWVWRWRQLAERSVGGLPEQRNFEEVCALAAALLEYDHVRAWAAASFPLVLVDEAQDLTRPRLRIVQELARRSLVLAAADEFQCLQETLRPNPFAQWSSAELHPTRLERVWRTNMAELLDAAANLRDGRPPAAGRDLRIQVTPNNALAGTWLTNQVIWNAGRGTVAVLAPTITPFIADSVDWARQNQTKQGNGPLSIAWERTEAQELSELKQRLVLPEVATIHEVVAAIEALPSQAVCVHVREWALRQRCVCGRSHVARNEVEGAIELALSSRRRFGRGSGARISAMTIHAAKNREFDGVVVIWPYQVAGDDEHKRRLLYNAITRARRWCLVLVQGEQLRNSAPFA